MIQAIVSDFSRVLLFPADDSYHEGLNKLNRELLAQGPGYDFWHYFRLNQELLDFYESLGLPLYIFTSDTIQDHPAVRGKLGGFKRVMSAKDLGIRKADSDAYEVVAREAGRRPDELLFIDDQPAHVEAAAAAGYRTILYESNRQTMDAVTLAMQDHPGGS